MSIQISCFINQEKNIRFVIILKQEANQIIVNGDEIETHDAETAAKDFYRSIAGIKKQLIEYIHKTKSEVMIYFVIQNYNNEYMHLGLSKESIKLFAELSASVEYDGL